MTVVYKPYRVLQTFTTSGRDEKVMRRRYPNAKRYEKSPGVRRSCSAVYEPGIINVPSAHEVEIFKMFSNKVVVAIPQDGRGFDRRDSGVARSVKTSARARDDGALEAHKRNMADKIAAQKEEAEKAAAAVAEEEKTIPEPGTAKSETITEAPSSDRIPGSQRKSRRRKPSAKPPTTRASDKVSTAPADTPRNISTKKQQQNDDDEDEGAGIKETKGAPRS